MAYEAVGQDLLSILKMFTSPRMGPFENTNATTKMPPGSDAARAASDPSRYGAPGGGGGLPPSFPSPVSRRVVQPEDPETTGSVPSPAGRPPAAVPGQVAQAAPAGNSLTDFMNADPAYQAYMAQVRRQQAEARQQQAIENIFGGLADVARARGLSVEGGPSGAVKVPTGDLPLDVIQGFQKRKEGLEADAADLKRIDQIVADPRMKGVTKEVLLSMRANNKDAYTDLLKSYFNRNVETRVLENGDIVEWDKNTPNAVPRVVISDPTKAAKAAADLNKTKADTNKTITEDEVKKLEKLDPAAIKSPENLARIERLTTVPAATLATMSPAEIQKTIKDVTTAAAGRNDPREWEGKEIVSAQDARKKLNSSLGQIPTIENLQDILAKEPYAGSASADAINAYYRNINTLFGSPLDERTMAEGQFRAQVGQLVRTAIKDYGANPSNTDREAAGQEFGLGTPPAVAKAQLGLVLKSKIWEAQRHNADIQDRIDNTDMAAGSKAALKAQMVNLPKVSDQTLRAMNIDPVDVEFVKSKGATPEARAWFSTKYGRNLDAWALGEQTR